jgi:hypothetical protein
MKEFALFVGWYDLHYRKQDGEMLTDGSDELTTHR